MLADSYGPICSSYSVMYKRGVTKPPQSHLAEFFIKNVSTRIEKYRNIEISLYFSSCAEILIDQLFGSRSRRIRIELFLGALNGFRHNSIRSVFLMLTDLGRG